MQCKTARIWWAFGGERDNSRQKSKFCEWKVARKPGMLPQTNLLKCMRSSWQFPFKLFTPNHKNRSPYIFQALRKAGANKISAYVTHGVFPQDSWKRFTTADVPFDNFFITDSLPYATDIATHKPFQLLSLTEAISEALLGFDLVQR